MNVCIIYPSGKLGDLIWHLPFIKIISNNSSDNNGSDTKIEDSPIVRMAITMGGKVINKKDNK